MKFLSILSSLAALAVVSGKGSDVNYCDASSKVGDTCLIKISEVRPTQFTIGQLEVDCKVSYVNGLSDKDLDHYLSKNPAPVWIGPNLEGDSTLFYITDGHHLARVVYEASLSTKLADRYMYATIEGNLVGLKKRSLFLQSMVAMGKIWLYDELGNQPINPEYLPDSIEILANDPHRSLAWLVQINGGYTKVDTDRYQEFVWGEYLRSANIFPVPKQPVNQPGNDIITTWSWCAAHPYSPLDCYINQKHDLVTRALTTALPLAGADVAKNLPGFAGGKAEKEEPKCGWGWFNSTTILPAMK